MSSHIPHVSVVYSSVANVSIVLCVSKHMCGPKAELVLCVCVCVVFKDMCLGWSCMCGNYYKRGVAADATGEEKVTWDTWTSEDCDLSAAGSHEQADQAPLVTCTLTRNSQMIANLPNSHTLIICIFKHNQTINHITSTHTANRNETN